VQLLWRFSWRSAEAAVGRYTWAAPETEISTGADCGELRIIFPLSGVSRFTEVQSFVNLNLSSQFSTGVAFLIQSTFPTGD
jgi:hypothetical protein